MDVLTLCYDRSMRTKAQWFREYSKSHKNPTNIKIHKICVPLIVYSLLGLLWLVPAPSFYPSDWPALWGSLLLLLALAFYISWGDLKLLLRMLGLFLIPNLMLWEVMSASYSSLILPICLPVFVIAWIGQFVGHKIEGAKPSFLTDIQFLLVGPAWVFEH